MGENNIVFGSDSPWYGGPQWQIEALWRSQIPEDMRDRWDYPELDEDAKRKILGLNSARLYGLKGNESGNCHGWQNDRPPIASTVESFRLMLADGRIVRCSRTENAELFAAALGGYGLFGIILDAELRVIPNARYRIVHRLVQSSEYVDALDQAIRSGPVGLAYGRLNVTREHFLERAMLTTFVRTSDALAAEPIVELGPWAATAERLIFRGSQGSEYGKGLRWTLETRLSDWLFSGST